MDRLFAVCAPGLEEAAAGELADLGLEPVSSTAGGVEFLATVEAAALAHRALRTVVRVLLRVAQFPAPDRAALAAGLRAVPWDRYAVGDVRTAAHRSRLRHTGLLDDAVREALGGALVPGGPGGAVFLRMDADICTVSVDMAGEPLHRRGGRADVGPAPLRETTAAGVLRLCGWPGELEPALVDPLCGTGVLPVEAAGMALALPAGAGRAFAWQAWPSLSAVAARGAKDQAAPMRSAPLIRGSDLRPEAVEAARAHAARAGVAGAVTFAVADAADAAPPEGWPAGLVVCNPPWGRRLPPGDAWSALGRALRRFRGWRAAVIGPPGPLVAALERALGRGPDRVIPFRSGGAAVALRVYGRLGVRARSRRRPSPGRPRRTGPT